MAMIEWTEFSSVMSKWIAEQDSTIQGVLRPNMWRRLLKSGAPTSKGQRFSADAVVKSVLGGRDELRSSVAVPVCTMLNEHFDGGGGEPPATAPEIIDVLAEQPMARHDRDGADTALPATTERTLLSVTSGGLNQGSAAQTAVPVPSSNFSDSASVRSAWEFPEFDGSREDLDPLNVVTVDWVNGRFRYRWNGTDESELYRVVVDDVQEPDTPDDFRTVTATEELTAFDDAAPESPYRFVTVWGYEKLGATPADGLGQCRLVARELYVHPLRNLETIYTEGTVVATWRLPRVPKNAKVDVVVSRMSEDETFRSFTKSGRWLAAAFADDGTGYRAGFRDTDVREGLTYSYAVGVRVRVSNVEKISVATRIEQSADSGTVCKVTDLQVMGEAGDDGNWCRIRWTPPVTGSVHIFRTRRAPGSDAAARDFMPLEQLAEAGLDEESRLRFSAQPVLGEDSAGLVEIKKVKWPEGEEWDTIHFTPVTVLGDRAAIGGSVTLKRAGDIRDIRLVQRLSWQLVTFDWPGEAVSVDLRLARKGTAFNREIPPDQTVSRSQYQESGGFVIVGGLPPEGCDIQLSAISYFNGERIYGRPEVMEAPELWGFLYTLKWPAFQILKRFVGETHVEVEVIPAFGDCPPDSQPRFVVVHNADRLPLSPQDGRRVPVFLEKPKNDGAGPVPTFQLRRRQKTSVWFSTAECDAGFFRLFSDTKPQAARNSVTPEKATERYAVVDPGLEQLRNR